MIKKYLIYFAVLYIGAVVPSNSEDASKQKPLFPISINHEFSNGKACFDELRKVILDNYYTTLLTDKDLYWAGIKGMLRHISPPDNPELATIWTAEDYSKIENSLKGVKVSIGVQSSFNVNDGSLTITEVFAGSPAESILVPYDRILRIDGELLKGKGVADVNRLLQGEPGTSVTLTIVRDIKVFDITIKREQFKTKNLIVSILAPGDIAFVEFKKITANMAEDFKDELVKLKEKNIEKLIIDFRNNTGGVFGDSLNIAKLFLKERDIVLRTLSRSDQPQNYVAGNKAPFEFKIVILVNKKTASSCEIIVGALQDHKKAKIIGSNTFGKAVFEKTFTLKNDYRVKFISGAMYTPAGKSWHSKGITPDFAVNQEENNYLAVAKLEPALRLQKDIGLITAYKLINR